MSDVIDTLAGLSPDSPLAQIRDRKPITRQQAQASHDALFAPAEPGDVTPQERYAIACFVAGLHAQEEAAAYYGEGLRATAPDAAFIDALTAETARARTNGPYGAYPKGPLSAEDVAGPSYHVSETNAAVLGARLAAAMAHVHMLVYHPRDASPAALQALLNAGWSNAGIVTLSQLVAFLAFQIRAAAGMRVLAATPSGASA